MIRRGIGARIRSPAAVLAVVAFLCMAGTRDRSLVFGLSGIGQLGADKGAIFVRQNSALTCRPFGVTRHAPCTQWAPLLVDVGNRSTTMRMACWPIVACGVVACLRAGRRTHMRRRRRESIACGYLLPANNNPICPECGHGSIRNPSQSADTTSIGISRSR